jgi:hypothetical protein
VGLLRRDMDIKKQVLKEMRNPKLYLNKIIKYVEDNVEDAFNICCRKGLSINEWKPNSSFGKQVNQKTVLLTVRMFDLWETALVDVFNEHLSKLGVKVVPSHDSRGDLTIIFPNKEEMIWEVKTTQSKNSWTGATHSASKYKDYILIGYDLDKDMKLHSGNNKGFIKDLVVIVWDEMNIEWLGKPSENSSWTTLPLPIRVIKERPEIVVIGNLEPSAKWCKIIREPTAEYH